jgi:hypothetical protein
VAAYNAANKLALEQSVEESAARGKNGGAGKQ